MPVSFTDVHEGDYFYQPRAVGGGERYHCGHQRHHLRPRPDLHPGPDRHLPVQALRISGAKALRSPLRPSPEGAFFVGGPGPLSTWGGGTTPPLRKPWAAALWCRGPSPFCLRRRCSPSSSARPCGSWRNRGPAPSKGAGGDCGFAGEGV